MNNCCEKCGKEFATLSGFCHCDLFQQAQFTSEPIKEVVYLLKEILKELKGIHYHVSGELK